MHDLIQDMLIWLATFFGVSLALICAVRLGLSRIRKQRAERLKDIEARSREFPDALGLPLIWRSSPTTLESTDYRWVQMFQWTLPAGFAGAACMLSATGEQGRNWRGAAVVAGAGLITFLACTAWLNWRRETALPRQVRRLVLALRCGAVRISAGMECHAALEQTARQMRRLDPAIAQPLEAGVAAKTDRDLLQRAFYPYGKLVSERLPEIVTGAVSDPAQALGELADQLETYYLSLLLSRTRFIEGWLKYPLILCLVPAVNLILFGPAIANLMEKFGSVRFPGAAVAPLEGDTGIIPDQELPAEPVNQE